MKLEDIEALRKYAQTERKREYLDALVAHDGNIKAAATSLGLARGTVLKSVQRMRTRAAQAGEPDFAAHVPEGFGVTRVGVQLDAEGEVRGRSMTARLGVPEEPKPLPEGQVADRMTVQANAAGDVERTWTKTKAGKVSAADVLESLERALKDWEGPLADPVPAPEASLDDLLTVYPWGDPHVGMLSWAPETGANYDLRIAERLLTSATRSLVRKSPASGHALLLNLGDFFHADNQTNATPGGGNQLDVDGRRDKIIDVGIRLMASCIELMLVKHPFVTVVNVRGNHDPDSALWLSRTMKERYRNEPRVTVRTEPAMRGHLEFGTNLLGWTHGHGPNRNKLQGIMAHRWPRAWGRCTFRKWFVGHVHHKTLVEDHGCFNETYNTIAPPDAWHAKEGYSADRYSVCEVYNKGIPGPVEIYKVHVSELGAGSVVETKEN